MDEPQSLKVLRAELAAQLYLPTYNDYSTGTGGSTLVLSGRGAVLFRESSGRVIIWDAPGGGGGVRVLAGARSQPMSVWP
jgi:hypothetical protein